MMFKSATTVLCISSFLSSAYAAPIFGLNFGAEDSPSDTTALSVDQVSSTLLRPALHSRVAYCSGGSVRALTCGGPCDALGAGQVEVTQTGGDDGKIPMYYIAVDKAIQSVVVAHQGTESKNILSLLNDAQFLLKPLNASRFPDQPTPDIQVHDGFQQTFERTADGLLAGVQKAMADNKLTKVLVTGHSLGAAIATLDSMMLKAALPANTEITTTVFGLPRVGNSEWADFVDDTLGSTLTHVSNQNDPVPTVPPQFIGFVHPGGEVHITQDEAALDGSDGGIISCAGRENASCSEGNSVLDVDVSNHNGPYFEGIGFGGKNCPA